MERTPFSQEDVNIDTAEELFGRLSEVFEQKRLLSFDEEKEVEEMLITLKETRLKHPKIVTAITNLEWLLKFGEKTPNAA